jgi:hypothetical protein
LRPNGTCLFADSFHPHSRNHDHIQSGHQTIEQESQNRTEEDGPEQLKGIDPYGGVQHQEARPFLVPTNSATMAPTTLSVAPTRSEAKK